MKKPNLFDQFPSSTKSHWIDRVNRDLKGRSPDDLNFQLAPELEISPFHHIEDITEKIDIPTRFCSEIFLGYHLNVTDEFTDNQLITEQLAGGVNYLSISFGNLQSLDFQKLFKGVFLSMIQLHLEVTKHNTLIDSFLKFAANQKKSGQDIRFWITCEEEAQGFHKVSLINPLKENSIYLILGQILYQGNHILESVEIPEQVILRLPFGHDYLLNICQVRAARLLWANLCDLHNTTTCVPLIIEGHASPSIPQKDHYANMIALSQVGVSMITAGSDVIFLPPSDANTVNEGTEFSRRISRNIYHLLQLECHMGIVHDPTAGSYFFDKTASEIASQTWHSFSKNITNA